MVEASVWWTARFASMNGVDYTRSKVVLWAANKDGGAHVDDDIPAPYAQLKDDGAFVIFFNSGGVMKNKDAHYTFLRTMACEVLHSPDLLALAR
jgi:hypothetical protein